MNSRRHPAKPPGPNETLFNQLYSHLLSSDEHQQEISNYCSTKISKKSREDALNQVEELITRLDLTSTNHNHNSSNPNDIITTFTPLLVVRGKDRRHSTDISCNSIHFSGVPAAGGETVNQSEILKLMSMGSNSNATSLNRGSPSACNSLPASANQMLEKSDMDVTVSLICENDEHDVSSDDGLNQMKMANDSSSNNSQQHQCLLSPIANTQRKTSKNNKRNASASGKRGADTNRLRLETFIGGEPECAREADDHDHKYSDIGSVACLEQRFDELSGMTCTPGKNHHRESLDQCQGQRNFDGIEAEEISFGEAQYLDHDDMERCNNDADDNDLQTSFSGMELLDSISQSPIERRKSICSPEFVLHDDVVPESDDDDTVMVHQRRPNLDKQRRRSNKNVTFAEDTKDNGGNQILTWDTIETAESSRAKGNQRRPLYPSDVMAELRDGACFRMPPIKIKRQQKEINKSSSSFVASTSMFAKLLEDCSSRTVQKLENIKSWLAERDDLPSSQDPDATTDLNSSFVSCCGGVVAALSLEQTHAMIFSLLSACGARSDENDCSMLGGTLLVVHDKSILEALERMLRQNSSFSVFNHGNLSAIRRKQVLTSRCAGYDIVLTTIDAFKAKEHTQAIDEQGAVFTDTPDDGWYSRRRDDNAQQCLKLSLLHGITWWRVIFVDIPGSKSFVTKPNTLKAIASKAVNSRAR